MNRFYIIGNITRDPELTETANGTNKCFFTVAVNRPYTNAEGERQTDFFNCTAWRATAENVSRYCEKGSKVAVMGSVQLRTYEDNNGNKREAIDVIVQDVEFLTPKRSEEQRGEEFHKQREDTPPKKSNKRQIGVFDDDGDIPF